MIIKMDQAVLDRAVALATRAALSGNPVTRIIWIPPQAGTDDYRGAFAVETAPIYDAATTPPWERQSAY